MAIKENILDLIEAQWVEPQASTPLYTLKQFVEIMIKIDSSLNVAASLSNAQQLQTEIREFLQGNSNIQNIYQALQRQDDNYNFADLNRLKDIVLTDQPLLELLNEQSANAEGLLEESLLPPQALPSVMQVLSPGVAVLSPSGLATAGSTVAAPAAITPNPILAVQPPAQVLSPIGGAALQPSALGAAGSTAPSHVATFIPPAGIIVPNPSAVMPSVGISLPLQAAQQPSSSPISNPPDIHVFSASMAQLSEIQAAYMHAINQNKLDAIPGIQAQLQTLTQDIALQAQQNTNLLQQQLERIMQEIQAFTVQVEQKTIPPTTAASSKEDRMEQADTRRFLSAVLDKVYQDLLSRSEYDKIESLLRKSTVLSNLIEKAQDINEMSFEDRLLAQPKLNDEMRQQVVTLSPDERGIIKEVAINLGIAEKSAAEQGLTSKRATPPYQDENLLRKFEENRRKGIVPEPIYELFMETRERLPFLKDDASKQYSAIKTLNNILNYPGFAQDDLKEKELNELVAKQGVETEQETIARITQYARKHVEDCFEKESLAGKAMESIKQDVFGMLLSELLARREYVKSNAGKDPAAIMPFVYPTKPVCLRGPAGTGKTSVATAINNALHRKHVEQAVAGESDVSKIFGRGQNWADPTPGLVALAMIKSRTSRVGIFLDELEKAGPEFVNGMGNLLEAKGFASGMRDDYFGSTKELKPGSAWFIAAVNYWDLLPDHIKSRFAAIDVPGSNLEDKVAIVTKLKNKKDIFKDNGTNKAVEFSEENIRFLIQNYSDQPGAREVVTMFNEIVDQLVIEKGSAKSAYKNEDGRIVVTKDFIEDLMRKKNHPKLTEEQQAIAELSVEFGNTKSNLYAKELKLIELNQAHREDEALIVEKEIISLKTDVANEGMKLLRLYKDVTDPSYIQKRGLKEDSNFITEIKKSIDGLQETILLYKKDVLEAQIKQESSNKDELNKELFPIKNALNKTKITKVKMLLQAVTKQLDNVSAKDSDHAKLLSVMQRDLRKELKSLMRISNTLNIAIGLQNDKLNDVKIVDISSGQDLTKAIKAGSIDHFEKMYEHIEKSLKKYGKYLTKEQEFIKEVPDSGRQLQESNKVIEALQSNIQELIDLQNQLIDKHLEILARDLKRAEEAGNDKKAAEIKEKIAELKEKKLELAGNMSGTDAKRADGGLSADHRHEDKTATHASQSDPDAGGGLYPASQALGSNVLSAFNTGEPQKPLGLWARFKNWVKRLFGFGKSSSGANQGASTTNTGAPGSSQFGLMHPLSSSTLDYNADNIGVGYGAESKGTSLTFTPSAMLSAAKHQHAGNVGMVANGRINSADFKKFTQEEIANAKELKQVFKALQDAKDPAIIMKLRDIQVKFDYINQRKADPSKPLRKGSDEKKTLKAGLQKEIQDLKKLLEKNQITALNQIAKTLTKFSQHTSSKTAQLSLTAFYGQLNALNLYKDLDVYEENGALVVRDQQQKLIEAQLRGESLHVSSSQDNPSIASIVQMVIYALQGSKNTGAGFTITNCEACPKVALYLYLFSRAVDLSPKLSEYDNTKQAVDTYIAANQNTPELKPLIDLYTSIKDNPEKLSKVILLALRKWEKDFYHTNKTIELHVPKK